MPSRRALHRKALAQAVMSTALIALALAAAWSWSRRPAGLDELRIATAKVRSQAAEVALVQHEAGRRLPRRFVQAHAEQLLKALDEEADSLDPARFERPHQPAVAALKSTHAQLEKELRALKDAPRADHEREAALNRGRAGALDAAEKALAP
jgi:hypothetical protein